MSILGPLLFLLCINGLCNLIISVSPLLIPNDTTLILIGSNDDIVDIVNHDLKKVITWFKCNLFNILSLHIAKTHYIVFSLNPALGNVYLNINIDDGPVSFVS